MPHRRGLGKDAADQKAENELGRMVLREELSERQGQAGECYRSQWRLYKATLHAPRGLEVSNGRGADRCAECPDDLRYCKCALYKREWIATRTMLADTGCTSIVDRLVLEDLPVDRLVWWRLVLALDRLALHYGLLTAGGKVVGVRNRPSVRMKAPPTGT